jgi:WD40 repeat protein
MSEIIINLEQICIITMAAEMTTFSLGLDDVGDDFEHPRRLLQLPCKSVLAYGGDEGIIACLAKGENKFQVVQRYDDGVRAVAFSEDGKRVAVGFDSGEIQILKYDDYECEKGTPHPFAQVQHKADENDLLSQDPTTSHKDSFAGPQFDTPIRDLLFLRQDFGSFWLVIASESGMCMIDADSNETISNRLLERESTEAHGHCGIRGVSIHDESSLMASLAMDGRLCVWDIKMMEGSKTPCVTLLQKESKSCISRKDVGEVHGADAFDRSCRPVFHKTLLATPGQLLPVIRGIQGKKLTTIETTNCEDDGHVDSVVTMTFFSKNVLVTSGRDHRVILWKCDTETGVLKPMESLKLESVATAFCLQDDHVVYAACAKGTCAVIPFARHFKESLDNGTNKVPKKPASKDLSKSVDEVDDDDEVDFSPTSSSPNTAPRVRFLDDEADEDDGLEDEQTSQKYQANLTATANDRLQDAPDEAEDNLDDDDYGDLPPSLFKSRVGSMNQVVPPQPAFSVSSTPLDLARRYLCWNHIGSVTILHGDGEMNHRNTVDINFTDSAYKRPITFTDNMNIILGALGEEGAIFASDLQHDDDDDDSIQENLDELQMSETTKQAVKRSHKKRSNQSGKPMGSSLFFYRFETFGSLRDKDWYLQLPDGERVLGSACGQGWAAVMTR